MQNLLPESALDTTRARSFQSQVRGSIPSSHQFALTNRALAIFKVERLADDVEKHIEVKGTSMEGAQIFLTQNQVEHDQAYPHVALFLVSKIKVARDKSGRVRVIDEGEPMIFDPWELRPENLQTIQYRYSLP
jgi:hypothetical protein